MMSQEVEVASSSVNPGWDDSMPAWNLTTECRQWDEDYHPCPFPYTGLSSYSSSATHCDTLFARLNPEAFEGVQWFFIISYLLIFLVCLYRFLLSLVDVGLIHPESIMGQKFHDEKFERRGKASPDDPTVIVRRMNVFDYCNVFILITSLLQMINSCDLEGWSDRIPYKVHVIIGIVAQNVAIMTGIPITVNWMTLVHVWADPHENINTVPPYTMAFRNGALMIMWFVSFPITVSAIFVTGSCDNGCENGDLTCAGKSVYSIVLVSIVGLAGYYCRELNAALQGDRRSDKFKWKEFLTPSRWKSTPTETTPNTSPKAHSNSVDGSDDEEKDTWERLRKIWKLVAFSVVVSIFVIGDNFSYCFGHVHEIKHEDPPCTEKKTIWRHKMMYFVVVGSVIFLLLIPHRQRQSVTVARVLRKKTSSCAAAFESLRKVDDDNFQTDDLGNDFIVPTDVGDNDFDDIELEVVEEC